MSQVKSLQTGIKFKDTLIGKIPVDWSISRLGDLCIGKPEYGANAPAIDKDYTLPRYVRITDIADNGYLMVDTWKSIKRENADLYILREGDFLFARSGATVGKTYLYRKKDGECAFAGYLIRFKPDTSKLLPEFLFQFTHADAYYNWVKGMLRAGAQPNINGKEYADLMLPLPSVDEQKKIAEILTTVDDAIEETDRIIEKTRELKKGLMHKLLTRGIGHKKFKKTEIGEIPEEWEVMKLENTVKEFYNGGTPDTKIKEYWDGNIPWVTGADFINQRIVQVRRYTTLEGVKNSATNIIPKGSLLVVTRTGVGKLAIAPFDIAISQDITGVITDNKKLLPDFLYWFLDYHANRLKSFVQGTSINGLLREDLAAISICLPQLDEQKQIAKNLFNIDSEIDEEERYNQHLKTLKKSLMQILLTGRVRVKLH